MKDIVVKENTMTVKDVANAIGVSTDTVKNCIRRTMPNKMQNGKTTYLNEKEVALISKELKNNSSVLSHQTYEVSSQVKNTSTQLEVLERAGNALKDLMTVISDMKAEADIAKSRVVAIEAENKMLKHQVEYNKVIDCTRWKDVKKLLNIKEKWETVCNKLNFEEDVDYYKKCMGDDKYPTTMLTDAAVSRIKEIY